MKNGLGIRTTSRAGLVVTAVLAFVGPAGALAAAALRADYARSAASQVWPPFVLVIGLLLVGLVANEDGLFSAAGHLLARTARSYAALFGGAIVLVFVVTTLLNLDTSVAFLTPVLVYAGRARSGDEAPLLYGCILLSNAGSLLLPGSNLTNLIVLGHLHLSGAEFLRRMAPSALAAVIVTAGVLALSHRAHLRSSVEMSDEIERPRLGVGLAGIVAVSTLVLVLRSPALPVCAVGVAAAAVRSRSRQHVTLVAETLGLPVLIGLFGVAVALGTVGRSWSGPASALNHLDGWATAGFAAALTVIVNNLPAASLLAARVPPRPFALLIGLNIGPNLFATGSLAWFLWLKAARNAGAEPSLRTASRLGLVAVPLSIGAAVLFLGTAGLR